MSDWHLLRPEWLFALLALPLWFLFLRHTAAGSNAWQRVVAKALQPHVLSRGRQASMPYLLPVLASLVWSAAVLAAAGPSFRQLDAPLARASDSLVIALDLSRSMDVADVKPSRLARARLKLLEILERRGGGYTGLIVYSANAFTVVPLSDDVETIAALTNTLTTDLMPSRGSFPAAAIKKAVTLLEQNGSKDGKVLLIADGGVDEPTIAAARELVTGGHSLSVLAVGTAAGGPVPAPGGGFLRGRDGKLAVVGVPMSDLRRLAGAGGGRFSIMSNDSADLDRLALASKAGLSTSNNDKPLTDTVALDWQDDGFWFVLLLLPFAALLFRRGWLLCLFVAGTAGLAPTPSYAFSVADWFRNEDQRGAAHLAEEDYEAAASAFRNPEWKAAALFRDGAFSEAAEQLASTPGVTAAYNRGTALARNGDYEAAIEVYNDVLAADADHEDAAYNKKLLEDLLKQQQQQQDQQQKGEQSERSQESSGESSDNQDSQNAENSDEGDDAQPGDQQQQAESGEPSGESKQSAASGDEQETEDEVRELQEAMAEAADQDDPTNADDENQAARVMTAEERAAEEQEQSDAQWLRRIEHDPGGLLRRKFLRNYKRLGRDQDGGSLWPDDEAEPW